MKYPSDSKEKRREYRKKSKIKLDPFDDFLVGPPGAQPQPEQSATSPQISEVAKVDKVEQVPKQPSPVEHFASNNCASCSDYGVTCSCKADSPHRDVCF